jgi:putative peptidyl-prolyl cis-trans isomerase
MKSKCLNIVIFLIIATVASANAATSKGKWSSYDNVVAVVNDVPIVKSEVEKRYQALRKKKKFPSSKLSKVKSQVLDSFINESLLLQTAEEESIIISDKKVDNHIKSIMRRMNFYSVKKFKRYIIRKEKITWAEYRRQIKISLLTQQIMTYAINFTPPSDQEARAFYNKNRKHFVEVNVQHVLVKPKNSSFAEEKRVNKKIERLRSRVLKGESFSKLARKHSQCPSAKQGGSLGWTLLMNLDPYFANTAYQMQKRGQISSVIKSSFGYHIIKYHGRRYAPFANVKDQIFGMLANQKRQMQFKSWVKRRREQSDIKIYMKNYVKQG